jgi:uncharacterized protein YbjT (DUF2867 family)
MKSTILGATGFIGGHLTQRLLSDGHELTALCRQRPEPGTAASKCRVVAGSFADQDSLEEACRGADVVYHLVGIIAPTRTGSFQEIITEGTARVVQACRATGVKLIVYVSALGAAVDGATEYFRSKHAAEESVRNNGIDYVILRPSIVYGPGDGFVSLLQKMVTLSPVTPVIGSGKFAMQPVYIDDLVEAMVQAASRPEALNRVVDIGGPEVLEYIQILHILKKRLHLRRLNLHLPMPLMKLVAAVTERLFTPAPLTKDQLVMLQQGSVGSIELMKELFGIRPVSFDEGLARYMR